jgi:anti-sigma regulatory factor (Ser/Thr protein kinase)
MNVQRIDLLLPPDHDAPRSGRAAVGVVLSGLSEDVAERTRLLVSELLTNCLQHGALRERDGIGLLIDVDKRRIRVEVSDPGRRLHTAPKERWLLEHAGFGVRALAQLADRWGIDRGRRTVAWFEIDLGE